MENIQELYLDVIVDPPQAMRSVLNRDALWELADNIKQNGLINPITVRPKNGVYEVVAGHRRFSACKIAGLVKIPCVVRELTDEQVFEIMTAENLERADVPLLDECRHFKNAITTLNKSVAEIAKSAKRSVGYVESRLAIADMPEYMQNYLQAGAIKLGAAIALMEITDESIRHMWTEMAVRDGVSVGQAEFWVHGWKVNQIPGSPQSTTPPSDYIPNVSEPVKFECFVDGNKYDARLMRNVMVFEENLPTLMAIVQEMRKPTAPASN